MQQCLCVTLLFYEEHLGHMMSCSQTDLVDRPGAEKTLLGVQLKNLGSLLHCGLHGLALVTMLGGTSVSWRVTGRVPTAAVISNHTQQSLVQPRGELRKGQMLPWHCTRHLLQALATHSRI